jgi:hypothetical protein
MAKRSSGSNKQGEQLKLSYKPNEIEEETNGTDISEGKWLSLFIARQSL